MIVKCATISLLILTALSVTSVASSTPPDMDKRIAIMIASYPDTLWKAENNKIFFRNGNAAVIINDGREKSHEQKLEHGDVTDSLEQIYPAGPCSTHSGPNFEPGRIRSDALFKGMYGQTPSQVEANLVSVRWFGQILRVNRINGANKALERVHAELQNYPQWRHFLTPSAGVFNWRKVAGQTNLSVHSFGVAVDINPKFADYWRWRRRRSRSQAVSSPNRYPLELIYIFEKHGFIWGGRWDHYDTMHFEYRPELLAIGKRARVGACGIP
ncbi:hypothetical protein TI04_08650 [Achromatium sp. WMS2]|nr:hypothetical protein TI04_08650 [Achromatium sp. WMS2]